MKTQLINIQYKEQRIFVVPQDYKFNFVVTEKTPSVVVVGEEIVTNYNTTNNQFVSLQYIPTFGCSVTEKDIEKDVETMAAQYDNIIGGISVSLLTTNNDIIIAEPGIDELINNDITAMEENYDKFAGINIKSITTLETVVVVDADIDTYIKNDLDNMEKVYLDLVGISCDKITTNSRIIILPPKTEEVLCESIHTLIVFAFISTLIAQRVNKLYGAIKLLINELIPTTFSEIYIIVVVFVTLIQKQIIKQT
ncbi:MAG: hypothetical protein QXW48_01405 [Thermoplasmata archaeon]